MTSRTSAILEVRQGHTTASNSRSGDTVSAGAFCPQLPLHVPQKKMGHQGREPMMVPPAILADCIVGHAQRGFALCEALFHSPAQTTEPDQGAQRSARWGLTDRVGLRRLGAPRPLDHEPHGALWQALLTQRHPLAGKRL